jgi:hypothetical protein
VNGIGRWSVAILLVIATTTAVWLGAHRREERLRRQKAAGYQQALHSYTDELPLGATRKHVEDVLRARGASYEQVFGFDATNAYADLVQVGTETAPWYCNKNNVYIKFAFDAAEPRLDRVSQSGLDILRSIEVTPWLQDCL